MTLGEAIRETWPTMRREPLPTTVAQVKALRDSGYGCTTTDDRYSLQVMFTPTRVRARLTDRDALRDWDIGAAEVETAEWTHREFLEVIAEPAQRSLFDEAAS